MCILLNHILSFCAIKKRERERKRGLKTTTMNVLQGSAVSHKSGKDGDSFDVRCMKGGEFVKLPNPT
jgi:hypothetical protein